MLDEAVRQHLPHAAPAYLVIGGSSFPLHADFGPVRSAEYATADQTALLWLLTVVAAIALLAAIMTGISMIRRRHSGQRPTLLFVGWGPLGRICLLAVAIPITLFALYSQVSPFGGRQYGLSYAMDRVMLEFVLVGATVAVLLIGLSHSAIRRRAGELGIPVPQAARQRQRRWLSAMTVLIVLCAVAYVVCWHSGLFRAPWEAQHDGAIVGFPFAYQWEYCGYGFAIVGATGLLTLVWSAFALIRLKRMGKESAHFRGTLWRSMVPILASAVIVVGIFCGLALRRAEAAAVARITGRADVGRHNEIELSGFREMRERFVKAHEKVAGQAR